MKHMVCGCGHQFDIKKLPKLPFVQCPNCNRRLPVQCEPSEFMKRCPACHRFIEQDIFDVHCLACSGRRHVRRL